MENYDSQLEPETEISEAKSFDRKCHESIRPKREHKIPQRFKDFVLNYQSVSGIDMTFYCLFWSIVTVGNYVGILNLTLVKDKLQPFGTVNF